MRQFDKICPSGCNRLMRLICAILAALATLGVPSKVEAHGRNAVPGDPALLEQYKTGLGAYYNNDYAAALLAWRPLAERETESSAAQLFLGFMHATGLGVEKDLASAVEWYRRAAMQDNMLAQIRLAFLYRRGEGAAQDLVQAYLWATLAARRENHLQGVAETLQAALAEEMTPAQIAEAKRLADAWIEDHGDSE